MQVQTALSVPSGDGSVAPVLYFGRQAWNTLSEYVQQSGPSEINGFCYVIWAQGAFHVFGADDVFITKQVVTSVSAEVTGNTYARALDLAIREGRPEHEMRLQWHSHGYGQAYHSPTDMRNIESYAPFMEWFISLVTNARGEVVARLDHFQPHRLGVPMSVAVLDEVPDELSDYVSAQIRDLVTIKPPPKKASPKSVSKTTQS